MRPTALAKCDASQDAQKVFFDRINHQNNSFQNMYDMLQVKVDRFAKKTFFFPKKRRKQAFLEDTIPGYPDFGKSCMPNYWDEVNSKGTP